MLPLSTLAVVVVFAGAAIALIGLGIMGLRYSRDDKSTGCNGHHLADEPFHTDGERLEIERISVVEKAVVRKHDEIYRCQHEGCHYHEKNTAWTDAVPLSEVDKLIDEKGDRWTRL